ncbi:thioesterase family protein [Caldifermentibacillus hisashii]|uniref:acyl-CoA thioesterase n=1 Tax=Caldifermentibacillus hisashii TaxID=996558 RepID=UPI0031FC9FA7
MKKINYIEDFQTWQRDFEFYIPIKVRFSETDMFGHLNNTVPFIYFEQVRIELLKSLGFMEEWNQIDSHVIPVVADLQCDYIQQVFFDEEIKVYIKIHKIGQSSVDLHYMGKKLNDSICFTGRGTLVKLNKLTGKGEKWTEHEMNTIERQMKSVARI